MNSGEINFKYKEMRLCYGDVDLRCEADPTRVRSDISLALHEADTHLAGPRRYAQESHDEICCPSTSSLESYIWLSCRIIHLEVLF